MLSAFQISAIIATFTVTIILLCYLYLKVKELNVDNIINYATRKSEFSPTVFEIFDRSSNEVCDRLIIVKPFDWVLWAVDKNLYLLNPEGGVHCSIGSTPAVRIYADLFVETCLKLAYTSILSAYKRSGIRKLVPYEINSSTFTILSAINILVKDWITFSPHIDTDIQSGIYIASRIFFKQGDVRQTQARKLQKGEPLKETETASHRRMITNLTRHLSVKKPKFAPFRTLPTIVR